MRLSARSEYACLALIDLTENQDRGVCTIAAISGRKRIPRKYLEQILLALKRAGVVASKKGSGGGYRLAKSPGDISVAEVVRLMDGALAPVSSVSRHFYEPTPIEQSPKLTALMREIRNYVSDRLESTTFADIS